MTRKSSKVTIEDVARRAKVSPGTVSKVLNPSSESGRISEACSQAVRKAALQLGYQPNYHARSLLTGKARAIGVVLNQGDAEENGAPFWAPMFNAIDTTIRASGRHVVIVGAVDDLTDVANGLRFLNEHRVDALVIPGFVFAAHPISATMDSALPIVLTEFHGPTSLPVVNLDDAVGVVEAVTHLAQLGHRRLLWMGPPPELHRSCAVRRDAFLKAVQNLGLESTELCLVRPRTDQEQVAAARASLLNFIAEHSGFTAVVCYEETAALGAYAALANAGLRVPEDVSVIGFDDIYAPVAWPPMTAISHQLQKIGRVAALRAIELASSDTARAGFQQQIEQIPSQLMIRQSTATAALRG